MNRFKKWNYELHGTPNDSDMNTSTDGTIAFCSGILTHETLTSNTLFRTTSQIPCMLSAIRIRNTVLAKPVRQYKWYRLWTATNLMLFSCLWWTLNSCFNFISSIRFCPKIVLSPFPNFQLFSFLLLIYLPCGLKSFVKHKQNGVIRNY